MWRRIAIIVVLTLALPLGPAPAKQPPPGRSLVLMVKGVPKKAEVRIVVTGPKHRKRTVSTHGRRTLRHLRPGVYRILPRTLKTAEGTWTGRARPAKVRVKQHRGARVRVLYTAKATPPPPEEPGLPSTPFTGVLAPSSVTLVSRTSGGLAGDKPSRDPAWSPDGATIAFSSCATDLGGAPDNRCHLYTARISDAVVTRLPNTTMTDIKDWGGEPAWSPDGKRLAFTTLQRLESGDTDTNKDVYVVTAAGANPIRVSETATGADMQGAPAVAEDPQWSPDGTRLMFRSTATNLGAGSGDVYLKTLVGGAVVRTGAGERSEGGRWSTDDRIAFTAGTDQADPGTGDWNRVYDVYTATGSGTGVTAATADHGVWGPPTWSPAGALAFSTSSALLASDTNESTDIYTTGSPIARISTGPGGEQTAWGATDPLWSPDGQKVAYVATGDGPSTILVKNLVTGSVTQLVDPTNGTECASYEIDEDSGEQYCAQYTSFQAGDPAWSPDSTRIAFTTSYPGLAPGDGNGVSDVYVATL